MGRFGVAQVSAVSLMILVDHRGIRPGRTRDVARANPGHWAGGSGRARANPPPPRAVKCESHCHLADTAVPRTTTDVAALTRCRGPSGTSPRPVQGETTPKCSSLGKNPQDPVLRRSSVAGSLLSLGSLTLSHPGSPLRPHHTTTQDNVDSQISPRLPGLGDNGP